MPSIYKIVRGDDAEESQLPVGAAGAVIFGGTDGELVSGHLALHKDDAFVVIRHPIEDSDLRSNGETFKSANDKGILFHVAPYLCCECGKTVHVPQLSYRLNGGCLGPLLIGLGLGVVALVFTWRVPTIAFIVTFVGLMVSTMAWEFCSTVVKNRKFGALIERTKVAGCPACGCNRLAAVSKIGRKGLTLKSGLVVRVHSVGIS